MPTNAEERTYWSGLCGSAVSLAIANALQNANQRLVLITQNTTQAQIRIEEIQFFLNQNSEYSINLFPDWESLPYDNISPHQDIISRRLQLLSKVNRINSGLVVISLSNLMQRLPPVKFIQAHSFHFARGQVVDRNRIIEQLNTAAYSHVDQVLSPGEYAIRGGLLDIFPMGQKDPIRLDFFDDEIEQMRKFDPQNQRSFDSIEHLNLLPAREFPLTKAGITEFRNNYRAIFSGDLQKQPFYTEVSKGITPPGVEAMLPLFFSELATLFDYSADSIWVYDDQLYSHGQVLFADFMDRYQQRMKHRDYPPLPPERLYLKPEELSAKLKRNKRIVITSKTKKRGFVFSSKPAFRFPIQRGSSNPYQKLCHYLSQCNERVLITTDTLSGREILHEYLLTHNLSVECIGNWSEFQCNTDKRIMLCHAMLERGVSLPDDNQQIITEHEIYDNHLPRIRKRGDQKQDPESIIKSLVQLTKNSLIVHSQHGIGRYQGLKVMNFDGIVGEFMELHYRHGDKLYVPILSLDQIHRFLGNSETVTLDKLGGEDWQQCKLKAQEKAYDVAAELLEIQALRRARPGLKMSLPNPAYQNFKNDFKYVETEDQQQCIDNIELDLQSEQPMDRLVCGDVGFGKTEVALRAAFISVHNNLQVALLAPTTILVEQHYRLFTERFLQSAVQIDLLSRFKTSRQSSKLIEKLASGSVDIVIGTHALLQRGIKFKNLGLIIIDEEHRFGVRQKEQLKKLRSDVHVLTLTATPIPRTLNMAMQDLRSISIIASPPKNRLSVKTLVRRWNEGMIRDACMREINRGGQVFFVHNEVQSITTMLRKLESILPEINIECAHGQMHKLELERIMRSFYQRRCHVLLCSTIIESGIDIPNANTIIINRADRFGLAQLHQLRGRVGRSHHQAYAYLITPDSQINKDAEKRLLAISQFEDLGAGFILASHDLEIRGAGELLGESQSGSIQDVGYHLYNQYLQKAIKALQSDGTTQSTMQPEYSGCEINLHSPALIPEDYVNDVQQRLIIYKRIADLTDYEQLLEMRSELIDRFGLMASPLDSLLKIAKLRIDARRLGIVKIDCSDSGGIIEFSDNTSIPVDSLLQWVLQYPQKYKLQGPNTLRLRTRTEDFTQRHQFIESILAELSQMTDSLGIQIYH